MSKESHSFSVAVATEVGVPCAIVLQHILFLQKSNVKDGEEWRTVWVRRSVKSLTETYPYFTMKEIRGAIDRLEGYGRIVSKVENDNVFDRKKSFQVTKYGLELLGELPSDERANAELQKGKPHLYKRANDNVTKGQMLDYNTVVNNYNQQQKAVAAENENPSPVEERKEEKAPSISGGSPIGAPSASQPFRTYEPFDLYEQVEAIRTDYKMRENLTIVAKVPQPFFEPYLEAFKAKEEAIGCNHTSTREFRAHFINFCRARYRSERAQPAPSAQPTGSLPKNLRRV